MVFSKNESRKLTALGQFATGGWASGKSGKGRSYGRRKAESELLVLRRTQAGNKHDPVEEGRYRDSPARFAKGGTATRQRSRHWRGAPRCSQGLTSLLQSSKRPERRDPAARGERASRSTPKGRV